MKLLMDSDCLIKVVKSSLKEIVCRSFAVTIPPAVKREVVDEAGEQPDAILVMKNIQKKLLTVSASSKSASKGEEAVFEVFQSSRYDAICSDDKRFIKRLRLYGIPYMTPAVLVAMMLKKAKISEEEALAKLESLAPMISDDEYLTVKAFLKNWRRS